MSKNVILLTIDALRADHVGSYGYHRETTPFLDELASQSLVFENAYSASSHTREAIPAILTGRHPTEAVGEEFTRGAKTIPMLLPDEYASGAFHSNPFVSRAYGYDTGFDYFDDDLRLGQNKLVALAQRAIDKFLLKRGEYHARAEEVNERAMDWLDSLGDDRPFFIWIHYMDVHGPYNPPEGYNRWADKVSNPDAQNLYHTLVKEGSPSEEEVRRSIDLYDGEIRYVDYAIRDLIEEFDNRELLDDSLVILTADHGDLFGEYGLFGHPRYVYPELTRVPLMLLGPENSSNIDDSVASTLDIVPTILDVMSRESIDLPGESLIRPGSLTAERLVFSSSLSDSETREEVRFSVYGTDVGYRFTRDHRTEEIVEEALFELPRCAEIDLESIGGEVRSSIISMMDTLKKHTDEMLTTGDQEAPERQAGTSYGEIEERLEALGYK